MNETDTVIVGAGPAGLATAACLRKRGLRYVVLEKAQHVGEAWRRHYDRLHLHTAKALSALPFLPFPADAPKYPSRAQVVEYLDRYTAHFGIEPRFDEQVSRVQRDGAHWLTRSSGGEFRSRNVVIATGNAREPVRPSWPGLAEFGGTVLHSAEYRNAAPFAGKRVLVVGFGNSGGEIALDLCENGARTAICVRSPVNVVPREFLGLPIGAWGLFLDKLPLGLADAVAGAVSRITLGRLEPLGLRRKAEGTLSQIRRESRIPVLDIGTIARIRRGEIEVLPGIESFARGVVRFVSGVERPFDAVVLATGYRRATEFVQGEGPGLYWCGFRVVPTGVLREIAREAQAIAAQIATGASARAAP